MLNLSNRSLLLIMMIKVFPDVVHRIYDVICAFAHLEILFECTGWLFCILVQILTDRETRTCIPSRTIS